METQANKQDHTRDRVERAAVEGDYDAVVVGAGFGGLYALHRLREKGLSVIGFEAAPEVGGTWYWNRYPGVRCDVPSLYYSYTWSEELRRDWRWSEKYAARREILDYAKYVADRFKLRDLLRFQTRVVSASFDEASGRWLVRTDRGDQIRARFCIMATGALSVPNSPKTPGLESFRGPIYHTARWPEQEVDFSGLRVGVVGTGSSGVQAIPLIAEAAKHVVVFQRTPNFSVPARNRALGDEDFEQFDAAFPAYCESLASPNAGRVNSSAFEAPIPSRDEQWRRYEELWQEGGGGFLLSFPNLLTHEAVNDVACDFVREKIRQIVKNPTTAAALSPSGYPLGVKRICVDTNYYETFNRDNVDLVNLKEEPLEALTADGVKTSARQFDLDALVFATGFDAITGALFAMDIRGRNELRLQDAWAEGPRAYLGIAVADFPNLFIITGPGSPSVIGNMINASEQHVDWLTDCIDHMRAQDFRIIEPDPAAERAWMTHVAEMAERTLFPKADSWYLGANIAGKPRVFMPYVGEGYRHRCAQIAARGYEGFHLT
ncbi:NAD(P)/FAD-dependent oxidoreductase [Bradyrhizobium sp. AUGA SZCCT0177]|uniref:flavin-containing monooxygenase n=1 Tax=Bradyrhizobium sp. AUGA SZCCT0177 TaxID=2807665 RepID=UPI001BA83F22|nr:NAD(P)/FAD-dependent oxidoreductase [Bradyrhizobium sp. AUGA SZCCT0177]MBR1280976.1 NAD(P)/FAD-dependent oxidoreductase [Bradyrhizobium sp. AUGA SZCCT0177]